MFLGFKLKENLPASHFGESFDRIQKLQLLGLRPLICDDYSSELIINYHQEESSLNMYLRLTLHQGRLP